MGAKFEELSLRVQDWAEGKGIYDKSTPLAQLNGAIGELYEFREAVIKEKSRDEQLMELGDVLVFLVNYSYMTGSSKMLLSEFSRAFCRGYKVVDFEATILKGVAAIDNALTFEVFAVLGSFANMRDSSIDECLEMAVNKIEQRSGKMQNGKFVKEDDL